jgi:1D-myo-inositol-tetrakisphosphate 5-kinase/inositol-polyphosphate multikinase
MASTSTTIPTVPTVQSSEYQYQVGGHAGVLRSEDGSLLIKPAVPNELDFYQRLQQDSYLEDLRVFTPTFLGTLELMGKLDETGSAVLQSIVVESSEDKDESFVQLIRQVISVLILFFSLIHNPSF